MKMNQEVWNSVLQEVEKELSPQTFRTFFSETNFYKMENDIIFIIAPTRVAEEFLNKKYKELVSDILFNFFERRFEIMYIRQKDVVKTNEIKRTNNQTTKRVEKNDGRIALNPLYVFDQFVVGKNSNFAYSAAFGVAENPGNNYNPLFIYGQSGMGKTHLMQAVGNYILSNDPGKDVYYISSEEFTNQMIESLRNNTMANFKQRFRNVDVLLVDDVHFLSRKESTQEEFFHTFNTLVGARKQIVLTSDRAPKEIPGLENRLVTRFESGLMADLTKPDFETRVAILRKKAEYQNIQLNTNVLESIADHISSSVRALEGSLIRILAYSAYNKIDLPDISPALALEIISDIVSTKEKEVTLDLVTNEVCAFYKITKKQIFDQTRQKNIAFARQVAMYLASLLIPQISLKEIANHFHRKDHTTVIHAKKVIDNKFNNDQELRVDIETLIKEIKK